MLAAAQSGVGGSGYGCEQGVPTEAALLATLAAFAVSFGLVSSTFQKVQILVHSHFDVVNLLLAQLATRMVAHLATQIII